MLAALLAAPAPAGAAEKVVSGVAIADVPRLAGTQVLWSQGPTGAKGKVVLERATPGGQPAAVTTGVEREVCGPQEDDGCDVDRLLFEGSPTRVAFEQTSIRELNPAPPKFTLSSGPFAGPFDALVSCSASGGALARFGYAFSLDGDAIAYQTDSCVTGTTGVNIVVRDLGPAAPPARVIPSDVETGFKLAGNFLALRKAKTLTVIDRTTGATVYTVTAAQPTFDFDIQADGKVAVAGTGTGCGADLAMFWASAASPTLHQVACGFGDVHIDSDRILFFRQKRTSGPSTPQIIASDLAGVQTVVASILGSGFVSTGNTLGSDEFDLQGSRVAYAVRDCVRDSVYVQDLPAIGVTEQKVSCPVSFGPKTAKVSKKGKVSIPVTCPKGCDATLSGAVIGKGNTIALDVLPNAPVLIAKGSKTVTIKLTEAGLKALRKKGKLLISLGFFGPPIDVHSALTLKASR